MNDIIQNNEKIFAEIKSDFNSLWNYKLRGGTLEIITPFSTLINNFITVFLTQRGDRFIVSDGQNLKRNLEKLEISNNHKNTLFLNEIANHYEVKKSEDKSRCFYFKSTTNLRLLTAYIYDVVFFQNAVFNLLYSNSAFCELETQEQRFSTQTTELLQRKIEDNRNNNFFELDKRNPLITNAGFNAVLKQTGSNRLWAAMCISGSSPSYFCNSMNRATAGFLHVNNQKDLKESIYLAAIIDETAKGNDFQRERVKFTRETMLSCKPAIYNYQEVKDVENLIEFFHHTA